MLNRYVWSNYLRAGGAEIVEMFRKNLLDDYTEDYAVQIRRMISVYCPFSFYQDDVENQLLFLKGFLDSDKNSDKSTEDNEPNLTDSIFQQLDAEYEDIAAMIKDQTGAEASPSDVLSRFLGDMAQTTTLYAMIDPERFIPYYYQHTFNMLQMIAEEFGIALPEIPKKKDYRERFYYYGAVCKALTTFRTENDLSPYELCAFLYDFAPKYIGGYDSFVIYDLPEPKNAFLIGSSKDDPYLPSDDETDATMLWQCSENTRPGDMILMYLTTPVSAIDSIWQACSVGFIDPFFFYYRCTYLRKQAAISQVSLHTLRHDDVTSKMAIVRKNMQGVNGVELKPSEYNRIIDLAGAKAYRFEYDGSIADSNMKDERDVEDKLIKPLLSKMGYDETDYIQQMYIELGNHNHTLIPDFVLLPRRAVGHASAFAIVEAKRTITKENQLQAAKTQARSYANQLKAQYTIVASQEKVWITGGDDDFDATIFAASWAELGDPDTLFALSKLIGKKRV